MKYLPESDSVLTETPGFSLDGVRSWSVSCRSLLRFWSEPKPDRGGATLNAKGWCPKLVDSFHMPGDKLVREPMAENRSKMYKEVKTWNPFKGCLFDCSYCGPSFQAQSKRQMHNCTKCYNYVPHYHPDRLHKFPPRVETIFVCGNSDISFSSKKYTREIINSIWNRNKKHPEKTYYF